jgi:L-Ala-D/L-Glu epimerase
MTTGQPLHPLGPPEYSCRSDASSPQVQEIPVKASVTLKPLELNDPFSISRDTRTTATSVLVELECGGVGEAVPVRYHQQTPEGEAAAAQAMAQELPSEPWDLEGILGHLRRKYPRHSAALCAVDLALHDWIGKEVGLPLFRYFGCAPPEHKQTSFTIGIDTLETMLRKVAAAKPYPILKIKLGRDVDHDIGVMRAIRDAAPEKLLRVDANGGWSLADARKAIPILADLGVEYVEQPLAMGAFGDLESLHRESPLPLFLDEDISTSEDVVRASGLCTGVNLKLMKCGGLLEARKMMAVARAHGLQLMIGCMIESSLAITAAGHLSPLLDYLDLDSHLLIRNDPFQGMELEGPEMRVRLPDRPGIGVVPRRVE